MIAGHWGPTVAVLHSKRVRYGREKYSNLEPPLHFCELGKCRREFSEEGFRDAAFSVHLLKNIGPKDLITMKSIRVSEDATMGAASRMVICGLVAGVCHYRHSGNS
ncbi:MAG TPA: hypothetical protein VJW77_05235 [Terriglobia bacterium]|nr:hypothetical protein [Terriglobia bacterium]